MDIISKMRSRHRCTYCGEREGEGWVGKEKGKRERVSALCTFRYSYTATDTDTDTERERDWHEERLRKRLPGKGLSYVCVCLYKYNKKRLKNNNNNNKQQQQQQQWRRTEQQLRKENKRYRGAIWLPLFAACRYLSLSLSLSPTIAIFWPLSLLSLPLCLYLLLALCKQTAKRPTDAHSQWKKVQNSW